MKPEPETNPPEWIKSAAEELATHFNHKSTNRDDYVTDEQRAAVAVGYAAIITRHYNQQKG